MGGRVVALNPITGSEAWATATGLAQWTSPVVTSGGTVYTGFTAVAADASLLWSRNITTHGAGTLINGTYLVLDKDGTIHALSVPWDEPAAGQWPMFMRDAANTGRKSP
jgi:outer membrane protein assembly factor BamB